MNLVKGEILNTKDCDLILDRLESHIIDTLNKERLAPDIVIAACDRLVSSLDESMYLDSMSELGIDDALGKRYLDEARSMFSGKSLRYRLNTELGENYGKPKTYIPPCNNFTVTEEILPLGVLLHIAAGNADGLPVFSVLEGLLTGNINILKLPSAEGGISVRLLLELIREEPRLAEYIYVFDYSSRDIERIERLISVADAVVVWGGQEAVSAIRGIVPPHIRLIEWGHKISFAYVTEQGITDEKMAGLAKNIADTDQLLCSSAQGIFIDTDKTELIHEFCRRFLPLLNDAVNKRPSGASIGLQAQVALRLYNEELEKIYEDRQIFKGRNCSLIAYGNKTLQTSIQFGNPWVRPLPRKEIAAVLNPYKNFLQTVGLLCGDSETKILSEIFFRTGVVRTCPAENMSSAYNGAPHDGEHPLRRYTKIVSIENFI